jgi:bifunctional non-homologous end joining protein LigD
MAKAGARAQIEFNEWTPDGHLRHSTFVGLRDDKEASDVVRKSAIEPNEKKA